MFVITADQVDSRHQIDIAAATMRQLTAAIGSGLVLPVDRTAGDEIQLLLSTAPDALTAILALTRSTQWSVGCGVGEITLPLAKHAREASGDAFIAAREAVTDAKKRDTRFALRCAQPPGADADGVADTEALIDLLLHLRASRSREGWEIYDLLLDGRTQAAAAKKLGITPQAASRRTQVAAVRADFAAVSALENRLAAVEQKVRLDSERRRNS